MQPKIITKTKVGMKFSDLNVGDFFRDVEGDISLKISYGYGNHNCNSMIVVGKDLNYGEQYDVCLDEDVTLLTNVTITF